MIKCSEHTSSPVVSQASTSNNSNTSAESKYFTNKAAKRAASLEAASESAQYCIHHLTYCGCPITNYTVVYRYSTDELYDFLDKITQVCFERDSSVQMIEP